MLPDEWKRSVGLSHEIIVPNLPWKGFVLQSKFQNGSRTSLTLSGNATKELYEVLKEYFENDHKLR